MIDALKLKIISQNILLTVIALVPLFFAPTNFFNGDSFKLFVVFLVTIVLFLALVMQKIRQDSFFFSRNLLFISIASILLSSIVSVIFSNSVVVSLFGRQLSHNSLIGLISLITLSYIVYSYFNDLTKKTKLFLTIYISGIVVVVFHLLFILMPFLPSLNFFFSNTTNTVGSWYDFGLYSLFVSFTSILVLQFLREVKLYRVLGLIGLVSGIISIILVNSLLVFLMAICFSLFYVICIVLGQHYIKTKKKVSYEALILFAVAFIFILIGGKTGVFINSTLNLQALEVRPSISSTIEVAQHTLNFSSIKNTLVGVGVDRFDTAWLLYRPVNTNVSQYWDVDFKYGFSTLLTIFVNQGVIGILSWIFFILISVFLSLKLIFKHSETKGNSFIYLYSAFGYLFFLTTYIVYTPSFVITILLFTFLGLLISNLEENKIFSYKEIVINKNPKISFLYILGLIVLLIAFIYILYIQTIQYSSSVILDRAKISYAKTGDIGTLITEVQKSDFIFSSDVYSRTLTDAGLVVISKILENKELTQDQAISQFREALQATIGYAQTAIAYDNYSYANRMNLEKVYKNLVPLGVNDAKDEAIKLLDSTEDLTPSNPTLYLEKARVYTLAKEYDQAVEQIKKAIELKPNYIDAVFLLSQIQVERGQVDEAINSIQTGIVVDKFNPNLRFQLGLLYYNKQKYNDAMLVFEDTIALSPNFSNAKYFLGLSYYKNNRTSDAIRVFEELAKIAPDNQEIKQILNNLKTGQDLFNGIESSTNQTPENREELPLKDENSVKTENE